MAQCEIRNGCLNLERREITDIVISENLTELRELDLENNKLLNIDALANLTMLQSLYLDENMISDN